MNPRPVVLQDSSDSSGNHAAFPGYLLSVPKDSHLL